MPYQKHFGQNNTIPEAFRTKFQIVQHNYETRHSENNFDEPKITFKATKFANPHVDLVSGIKILTGFQKQ